MKRNKKPLSAAEAAKQLGISQEQLEAQARKQADEYLGIHTLTPQERLELEKQAKASSSFDTWREDAHRRCGVPVPFPLEEIYYSTDDTQPADGVYDHDDPEFLERTSSAANGAINDYLTFFYKPELFLNKEQFKFAIGYALEIRGVYSNLKEIPLAANPDNPNEQDFIRLGQWFLDANTAIKAEIAKHNAREKALRRKPLTKKAGLIYEKLKSLLEYKGMTLPEIQDWIYSEHKINLDEGTWKEIRKELIPYGMENRPRVGYYIEKK